MKQQASHAAAEAAPIEIESWEQAFAPDSMAKLEALLPSFIAGRRWFRGKTRRIERVAVADVIPLTGSDSCILFLRIEYEEGECDHYLLPLSLARDALGEREEMVARVGGPHGEEGILYSAFSDAGFRDGLLNAVRCDLKFAGHAGEFIASRTNTFREECGAKTAIESFVSRAEQSNTSIIYRDRYILKLFRKVEPGVNPDLEIGRFLTERGFKNTPAVLGTLAYRALGGDAVEEHAAGLLQEFVPNQGDAWKYTLDSLSGFFERALARGEQAAKITQHPLELMKQRMPEETVELLGEYAEAARLLGKRTAEMHAALADESAGPDFAPEAFTHEDAERLYEEMLAQADITFELLRRKQGTLDGGAAEGARELLRIEHRIAERFSALREAKIDAVRIRYHGDYHLGQVLYTGRDFMIIDFEGEPARPLAHRRAKTLAMRDVAGMIRSFQYAAFAALFGQVSGVPGKPDLRGAVESWAGYWTAWVNAAYLRAYFDEAGTRPLVPPDPEQRRTLFDAFLLQKALYEVAYELNNRPDWVRIPLRGILSLMN